MPPLEITASLGPAMYEIYSSLQFTPTVEDYSTVITAGATQAGTQFGVYLAVVVGLSLGPWALIKGLNWVRGLV